MRTIVNLRQTHSDEDLAWATSLDYVHAPTVPGMVTDEQVIAFLRIATDPGRTPVFVHCRLGANRTGEMCAAYRIVVQGWTKDEAIAELTEGGFGFHAAFGTIPAYLRDMDVAGIRRELGLAE